MKYKIAFLLFIISTVIHAQNVTSLDNAIKIASDKIQNDLRQGTIVAVLNFSSTSNQFSSYVIDEIMDNLTNGRKLKVVDRQRLDAIRKEMDFQFSGNVSDESIQSIGKMLGAQSVITGSITNTGSSYRFRVFAINIENGNREASSSLSLDINDFQVNHLLNSQIFSSPLEYFDKSIDLLLGSLNRLRSGGRVYVINIKSNSSTFSNTITNLIKIEIARKGFSIATGNIPEINNAIHDMNSLFNANRMYNIEYIIHGDVSELGNSYMVNYIIYSTETGACVGGASDVVPKNNQTRTLF